MSTKTTKGTCARCDGTGFIESYAHVHNGRCFGCMGTGTWFHAEGTKKSDREVNAELNSLRGTK